MEVVLPPRQQRVTLESAVGPGNVEVAVSVAHPMQELGVPLERQRV
jgi:hypothetical protein